MLSLVNSPFPEISLRCTAHRFVFCYRAYPFDLLVSTHAGPPHYDPANENSFFSLASRPTVVPTAPYFYRHVPDNISSNFVFLPSQALFRLFDVRCCFTLPFITMEENPIMQRMDAVAPSILRTLHAEAILKRKQTLTSTKIWK